MIRSRLMILLFTLLLPAKFGCTAYVYVNDYDADTQEAVNDNEELSAELEDAVEEAVVPDTQEDEDAPEDIAEEEIVPSSCGFTYDDVFVYSLLPPPAPCAKPNREPPTAIENPAGGPDRIAHIEPMPESTFLLPPAEKNGRTKDNGDIVLPGYSDDMPLFERGGEWMEETRCYETPIGVMLLTQPEAFDLYRAIAELTTGIDMKDTPGVRSVVGIRGAYPGRFFFHGNLPNRFNDTLVLLWIDDAGNKNVREFPVNTDTGVHDFGWHSSSSLRPNRRYHYINGWHRDYNALHIDESAYWVRDDANKNGHWDSDRNGWLPPSTADDHDRTGSGHNIHMGSLDAPLGSAVVGVWSAGCQVIPGMANWIEFITHAWTAMNDPVDYFLVDVRDIDPRVWEDCSPDGTHACPYPIEIGPFSHSADTTGSTQRLFNFYNCSSADESGAEIVYYFTIDRDATVSVAVEDGDTVDIDVHLLDADDANSCLERDDVSFTYSIWPGRYFIIADTYVSDGVELSGPYSLSVSF